MFNTYAEAISRYGGNGYGQPAVATPVVYPVIPNSAPIPTPNPMPVNMVSPQVNDPWGNGMRTNGSIIPNFGNQSTVGGVPGSGTGQQKPGFFGNMNFMDTAELALGGLQTIGSLWGAWQANKLAGENLAFQKEAYNTNLANSISAYNTALDDKIRSRAKTEGMSDAEAQAYIDEHELRRKN
jgi:hypothetical protein